MSITHCIIMVMHAMLPIMAKLVRSPGSSSGREPFIWRYQEPFMAAIDLKFRVLISSFKANKNTNMVKMTSCWELDPN